MPSPASLKKRPIDEGELAETLETQFSLPRIETRAYIKLVQTPDPTVSEASSLLGLPAEEVRILFERMVERGLIIRTVGDPPRFKPLHPRMTLTNIFKMHEQAVVQGLRDRRATVDRAVNLLTPIYEERKTKIGT
ncbi:hypothetical protein AUG19_03780 [archaeon 13_1_20CM_2_54_9]|nr:MAG: hypothetical protein AUJ07_01755 [Crenarchaeota archaeon 13_1_40CM_3_53_5]OLE76056.1 MAG: hypothetical protein AUG19_03780 [archaeon 13_1_20CM_2_54_9]TMI26994.1 MAG: TrmB family transcriptional regulator [Candidatus Bathyarchaeota archaeon]TMI30857.1 MAG: TrmB family transcriptional regulator [Candidatus Bathyarchaeota archaeon]